MPNYCNIKVRNKNVTQKRRTRNMLCLINIYKFRVSNFNKTVTHVTLFILNSNIIIEI